MPSIDESRRQFDGLSVNDKYEYVVQLKEYVETKGSPEHRDFLIECVNKYNTEVQRVRQVQAPNNNSPVEAERAPEYSEHQSTPRPAEHNTPQQPHQRHLSRVEDSRGSAERGPGRVGRNAGGIAENPAGGIGNALSAIPKPIIISAVAVVVVGVTVLTLWLTGLLPWGRNADDLDDIPQIETGSDGDVLTDEIEVPVTDTIVLALVTGDNGGDSVEEVSVNDEEMYAAAFEDFRSRFTDRFFRNYFEEDVVSINDISYTFHDIDGNGIKELIITGGMGGVLIYTLSEGNYVELLYFIGGPWDCFTGISESGYIKIVGGVTYTNAYSAYYKIADNKVSSINTDTLGMEEHWGENAEEQYKYYYSDLEITEDEYNALEQNLTNPPVELDWQPLTETTGIATDTGTVSVTDNSGDRHPFAIALEEYNNSTVSDIAPNMSNMQEDGIAGAWYFPNVEEDGVELMIAKSRFENWGVYYYRMFYVYEDILHTYDWELHSDYRAIAFSTKNHIIIKQYGDGFYEDVSVIYSIRNGEVLETSSVGIAGFPEDSGRAYNEIANYWYNAGSNRNDGVIITEEQYNEYLTQYGLHQLGFLTPHQREGNLPDQTAQILAMTLPEPTQKQSVLTTTIDGNPIELEAITIDGGDFVKLRDLAMALSGSEYQFSIDETADSITLTLGQPYSGGTGGLRQSGSEQTAEWKSIIDGNEYSFISHIIDGEHYFNINEIKSLLSLNVDFIKSEVDEPSTDGQQQPPANTGTDALSVEEMILRLDKEYISRESLLSYSREELRLLRNGIYALSGYIFNAEELVQFFNNQSWYSGTISDEGTAARKFNDYQKQNLEIILAREAEIG